MNDETSPSDQAARPLKALVSGSPLNTLLEEWLHRERVIGRDVAHHPATLRRVMSALDDVGPSEAGDCIHSLVWALQIERNRAARFADQLAGR